MDPGLARLTPMTTSPEITLAGHIDRVTDYNREYDFTIALWLAQSSTANRRTITIKGTMPEPRVGESIEVRGRWSTDARYGQQLTFTAFTVLCRPRWTAFAATWNRVSSKAWVPG